MLQDTPSFLAYWRNARSHTVRVRSALGSEDLEWPPVSGALTFGDLFRHRLGLERFMVAENVQGRPSVFPGHGVALAIFGTLSEAASLPEKNFVSGGRLRNGGQRRKTGPCSALLRSLRASASLRLRALFLAADEHGLKT